MTDATDWQTLCKVNVPLHQNIDLKSEPFYFGPSEALYGIYHLPARRSMRRIGVVLCYPFGQEYLRAHRAYTRLASQLAQTGFPVLRFDYFGCGDSLGECEEGSLAQWLDDILLAMTTLHEGSDIDGVILVGCRLGASMAMMSSVRTNDIHGLVLWDPVISGARYLAALHEQHRTWLQGAFAVPTNGYANHRASEVLGFPLTPALEKEIAAIDLTQMPAAQFPPCFLVECGETSSCETFVEGLRSKEFNILHQHIPDIQSWMKHDSEESQKILVPATTIKAIVSWCCEVSS
jgi:pimeloyl-ACP methyl ester carboxylesterase